MPLSIKCAARGSALSRVQMHEVLEEIRAFDIEVDFEPIWVTTTGDRDLATSLRTLDKTDFFTKEIDRLQLEGVCQIAIHSAKDLPDPLPKGLELAALTKGVDPSDVLVLRQGEALESLPFGAKVGTSSVRREENVKALRCDLECVDIRGDILRRLELLDTGAVDALVMAEAALIRLNLTERNRITLSGIAAPLQGQLAVVVRAGDKEMQELFGKIDVRKGS